MPIQDALKTKEKILMFIKRRGPSLPVHISKETGMSMLFSGAFLSELVSEKNLKISNLRVGSSPLYFATGQEYLLENFYQYLKDKEKEAFLLLKEKKFLKDAEQTPVVRVALRAIKDFAIPFKHENEIYWRYFNTPEEEFKIKKEPLIKEQKPEAVEKEIIEVINKVDVQKVLEKPKEIVKKVKKTQKKEIKQKRIKKKTLTGNENFFNKIKDFLTKEGVEILDIESFNKTDLTLKVKEKENEKLIIAYNKKRLTDSDILKAYKKSVQSGLKYSVLSMGDTPKKITNLIEAVSNISEIKKVE